MRAVKNCCQTLLDASKIYGQCAGLIDKRIKTAGIIDQSNLEKVIGLGIARDWIRFAGLLNSMVFSKRQLNDTKRPRLINEIVRFTFSWSGINAIFSRDELLHVIGFPQSESELDRFRVLFHAAAFPSNYIIINEGNLHSFLSNQTRTRLPSIPHGRSVSTLQAINIKYIPQSAKTKGVSKRIDRAAISGNLSNLDIPTILYAFRNWSVHGNALDGSFGGRSKFSSFLDLLNDILSDIHLNVALALLNRI